MATPEHVVDTLRRQHGRIAKFVIKGTGEELFFRSLMFDEYLKTSDKIKKMDGGIYDFEPEVLPYLVRSCLIYPTDFDSNMLMQNPGMLYNICTYIMQISLFEDDKRLEQYYVDRYRFYGTVLGGLQYQLVQYYGIDGYIKTKELKLEEIIDLIVLGELSHQRYGHLSTVLDKPGLLPRDRKGRVNLKQFYDDLMANKGMPTDQPVTGSVDQPAQPAPDVEDTEREARLTQNSRTSPTTKFEDMIQEGIEISKRALAEQIARDKARYGDAAIRARQAGTKRYLGDFRDLDPALVKSMKDNQPR